MEGKLFFEIPDDQEVMTKLIEAVPSNWSWVDGGLYVLQNLLTSGEAVADTGFTLSRFHSIHPFIVGRFNRNDKKRLKPNLFAIMVEQKLPAFVTFDEAGYDGNIITFDLAKRVIVGFLQKGYRGSLIFFKDCHNNHKYDNSATCDFEFSVWEGAPFRDEEAGEQPARVRLKWDYRYGSTQSDVERIAGVCHSLNLRQYEPVATP